MALSRESTSVNCRNYLWTFAVLITVWSTLILTKPLFVLDADGYVNCQRVFWITLVASVAVVLILGV